MSATSSEMTYTRLPALFFEPVRLAAFPDLTLYWTNDALASRLGWKAKWLKGPDQVEPIAMAYSGHQFGHLSPRLGDGRAALIREVAGPEGSRHDIHLKGSGPTPFSRRGDGKSTLRAGLKEVLFSEFLHAAGVSTSRALAVYETGERVQRQVGHPGAVMVRSARSLIRVGTFQYGALNGGPDELRALADFLIDREYPDIHGSRPARYLELLEQIVQRQARLIADWMALGFIHGVMNTDNMALSGETIDFGPCAMMEIFHTEQVFSSIDHYGRYAWNQQPNVGLWNLAKLAETFLPILSDEPADAIPLAESGLDRFLPAYNAAFNQVMAGKLGLDVKSAEALIPKLWPAMQSAQVDFTNFFRALNDAANSGSVDRVLEICEHPDAMRPWLERWESAHKNSDDVLKHMDALNPVFVPRIRDVEAALNAAEAGNPKSFQDLLGALQIPFDPDAGLDELRTPSPVSEALSRTFCET